MSGIVDVDRPGVTCLTVGNRDGEIARAGDAFAPAWANSGTLEAQASLEDALDESARS
jgi:hypothetical protein